MQKFEEFLELNEAAPFEVIPSDPRWEVSNVVDAIYGSKNLKQSGMKYYIGTIGYMYLGREIWYELFELDNRDKKEFGSKGVFGFSSEKMVHQERTVAQIRGNKIFFMDNIKYEDDNKVVYNGHGAKIRLLRIKNPKYNSLFANLL